jgi:hypothetical protein
MGLRSVDADTRHRGRLIWPRDRDFRKFRGIEVRDPFE